MRRLKTVRRPPIYPKTPGHLPCSSLTHPLPLSSRRPSVSFGGFGLSEKALSGEIPAELGSLSYLKWLRLGGNSLSGCVPSSLEDQLNFDASYLGDLPFCGTGSAETDREALVALYKATNYENWFESDNWLSDAPIGEWYGVVTNDDGRVTALVLNFNGLSGEIPAELGSLSNLRYLGLSTNNLSGEIPAELGSLSNLRYLGLSTNNLSGEIPAELGSLSNLRYLGLSTNNLSGEIPAELGSLSNLRYLGLSTNNLSGEIPAELGSLSNLRYLGLSTNNLSGEIPAELGSLSNLESLSLSTNNLSGEIPAELGSLSNLEYLVLHSNELSGCVPSSLEDQLDSSYDFLGGLPFC